MNILDNSAFRSCTSCQICAAVCSREAISIQLDNDGFYRPVCIIEKCNSCGLCKKICYKFDDKFRVTSVELLTDYNLYAASANNDNVVRNTTSGGIADLLARQLFNDGYKVVGVIYDKTHDIALHQIANSVSDIDLYRGSKYIQPYSVDAFRSMLKNIREEKFAVFGLPCQIYSISRYLEFIHKRDNCLLIDLYCHGCPSMNLWKKVSSEIKGKTGVSSFDNVIWRSKLRGWGTYVLEVQKDGKRIFNSSPLRNEFYDIFFSNQILNESCKDCLIRGTLEYTDIRLGDFWGPSFRKTLRGVSGVTVVTNKGQNMFNRIVPQINNKLMPYQSFYPYQCLSTEYCVDEKLRSNILNMLKEDGVNARDIVKILPSHKSVCTKIKMIIKEIFFYLPKSISVIYRH